MLHPPTKVAELLMESWRITASVSIRTIWQLWKQCALVQVTSVHHPRRVKSNKLELLLHLNSNSEPSTSLTMTPLFNMLAYSPDKQLHRNSGLYMLKLRLWPRLRHLICNPNHQLATKLLLWLIHIEMISIVILYIYVDVMLYFILLCAWL